MTRRFVLSFLALTVFVLVVLIVPLGITAATRERDRLTLDLERDACERIRRLHDQAATALRSDQARALSGAWRSPR
mgnify:CR=1 FL=1